MDLSWMLEEYDGIVYVSDMDSHELLYMNKAGCELFHVDENALSRRPLCYEVLQGRDAPCPFCTNTYLNESGFYEWEFYNPCLQRTLLLKDREGPLERSERPHRVRHGRLRLPADHCRP